MGEVYGGEYAAVIDALVPIIKRAGGCSAVLNLAGEHFPCDWSTDETGHHEGWGHTNKEAQATWTGDDTEVTTAKIKAHA